MDYGSWSWTVWPALRPEPEEVDVGSCHAGIKAHEGQHQTSVRQRFDAENGRH